MMASPDTAACPGSPRWPWPLASSAAAPPTQKTSAKAAIASAATRRTKSGRSGKDGRQRNADDLQAARQTAERELAQVVLADAQDRGGVTIAGQLQRVGHVGQQVAQRLTD